MVHDIDQFSLSRQFGRGVTQASPRVLETSALSTLLHYLGKAGGREGIASRCQLKA